MSSQKSRYYDVVICGAGPAGTTCALALADSGLSVAVVEKSEFPREKICGDAVAAYVPNVLKTINPKYHEALEGFKAREMVNTCRVFAPNQKFIDIRYEKNGFIAKRKKWDQFLFELASKEKNISFFLNHTITDTFVDRVSRECTVTTQAEIFKTKLIIGCDGAQSVTTKRLTGSKLDRRHHAGAVRAYFRNVEGLQPETFELHFLKGILPGYFWIFPLKAREANVGLGLLSAEVSRRKLPLRELLQQLIQDTPYLAERFQNAELLGRIEGFGLPLGSRKVALSGEHFMLCGDAGSLIDPLSGEGIGQAMVSGRYAGWHAKKCFEKNNFSASFMSEYDNQVYSKFWARHRKDYWIQKLISDREWLVNGVFNIGHSNGWVRKSLVKAFA